MNYKFIGFIAAAAAISLVSCQKQEFKPSTDGTVITVNANVEDPANDTKTTIEEGEGVHNINWEDSELMMRAIVWNDSSFDHQESSEFSTNGDGTGNFKVTIPDGSWTNIAGVYPSSAFNLASGDSKNRIRVELPTTQYPSANSYDPKAYIMIARPASLPADLEGFVWDAYYYRAAALNKFTISNLEHGGNIISAKITFTNADNVTKYKRVDLTTTTVVSYQANNPNYVELKYTTPLAADVVSGDYNLWFTTWNVEVPTTDSFTVEITTDDYKYTKEFAPKKDGFALTENCLNLVALDMTDATAEELAPAEDYSGEYLIVGLSGTWNYMTSTTGSGYFERGSTDISKDYAQLSCADFYAQTGIEDCVWKFTSTGEGLYTITSTDGKFLTISGKNASLSENETSLYVEKQEDGSYWIQENNSTDYRLQYNSSDPRFKPYNSNQKPTFLVPWIESTDPILIVSQPEQTVAADAESVSFSYVAKNITGQITAAKGTDANNIISAVSVDEETSTVNVTLNPNTEEVEKTATITLSAEGANSITLTITQEAAIVEVTPVKATIAEFLAAEANTTDWYELTGTIVSISNTTYGNLTIKDETGEVDIYGLTVTKQNSNDKSFSSLGLAAGDILTLATIRGEYNGQAQGGGQTTPAYYISHEPAPVPEGTEIIKMSDFFSGTENLENGKTYIWGSLSVTFEKHNTSTSNYDGEVIRLYKNDKLTFDAGEKTIIKMEFEATRGSWSADTGTISGYNWEGESSIVTLTATDQVRFSRITVYYK